MGESADTAKAANGPLAIRPARPSDLPQIVTLLHDTIRASEFYSDRFKDYEVARLDRNFLRLLLETDPWHIAVGTDAGKVVALCLTIPDHGVIWSPWVCVAPAYRAKATGISVIRVSIRHWEREKFHKIYCYVRPGNRVAHTIYRRFGFRDVALLKNHVFGEDMIMMERPVEQALSGYDSGVRGGRARAWRLRFRDLFGF